MKRAVIIALGLLLLTAASAAAEGRRYAVVVGIDSYAVRDASALAATLRAAGFDKVFEMTTDQAGESYPTRTNLVFRLGWLRDRLQPEDSLVFFFAGHGMEADGKTFLLTKESDPRSLDTLKVSALPAASVNEIFDEMKARHILAVYDACRNSPRADRSGGANALTEQAARDLLLGGTTADSPDRVRATLFACSRGQRSYEWNDKQHGYFTYFLIEGLKGAARQEGRVTLASLIPYVTDRVKEAADEGGCLQQPYFQAEGTRLDGWVLAMGALSVPPTTPPPARPQPTPTPPRPRPSPAATPEPVVVAPLISGRWQADLVSEAGIPYSVILEIRPDETFVQYALSGGERPVGTGRIVAREGRYRIVYDQIAPDLGLPQGYEEEGEYGLEGDTLTIRPSPGSVAGGEPMTLRRLK